MDGVGTADTVHTIGPTPPRQGTTMQTNTKALHYDSQAVMIHVDAEAPAAAQLRNMLECFASATERPVDAVDDMRGVR